MRLGLSPLARAASLKYSCGFLNTPSCDLLDERTDNIPEMEKHGPSRLERLVAQQGQQIFC